MHSAQHSTQFWLAEWSHVLFAALVIGLLVSWTASPVDARKAAVVWIETLRQNVIIVSSLSARGLWPDRIASGAPPCPTSNRLLRKSYHPNGKANDSRLFHSGPAFFFFPANSVALCSWSKWKDDMIRAHFFGFLNNLNADGRSETLIKSCVLLKSCVYTRLSAAHRLTFCPREDRSVVNPSVTPPPPAWHQNSLAPLLSGWH